VPAASGEDVDLELAYAYPPDGSWVRANMVATLDGATSADDGLSAGLSGPADRRLFGVLRRLADVVLVGSGTARAEGYRPAALPIAIVSSALGLDLDGPLFTAAEHRTILLTSSRATAEARARAAERAEVVVCGSDRVDLALAVRELAARGHRKVLTEGGPTLLGSLVAQRVLDEVCLSTAPLLVGGHGSGILGPTAQSPPVATRLTDLFIEDGFLFGRYAVTR
jgi:riboflavin biosynthesis pyrimidine reductase